MEKQNKIVVNVGSTKKPIDPMIYSNFIEHLGECIHNGLWAYDPVNVSLVEGNPVLSGVRQDVLDSAKDLKVTVLRAFGGCYSDVYHWEDAIGPRDTRRLVKNKYWGTGVRRFIKGLGPKIENQFGTDEFLTFCEEIGAEPYLNVNYGSGTTEEAANWVEYCNGSEDTKHGALRVKNGRKKPYNVKFWGIANEIWGWWEVGHEKHPEKYAKKYLTFAKAMRERDPTIQLVACGCFKQGWNQTLLKILGEEWVDLLSIHRYLPMLYSVLIGKKHPHNNRCYHGLMASQPIFEKHINDIWEDIVAALGKDTHVRITFDEWGIWYKGFDIIKTNYNLQDGVWTALMLMVFQQNSDKCPMANWAQLVNCIGTVQTDKEGLIETPIYLAIKMLVDHSESNFIEGVDIDSLTFDSKKYAHLPKTKNTPYIACNATINDNNDKISLLLINKHFNETMTVNLEIKDFEPKESGTKIELFSESPFDYNTKVNRTKIEINEESIKNIKPNMTIELKPHSLSIIKFSKK